MAPSDLDNRFGNWWLANLQMESALKFKEYEFKFVRRKRCSQWQTWWCDSCLNL